MDVAEFTEMIQAIRTLENALGSPSKHFLSCEQNCFDKLGKSVVASRFLSHGHEIEITDLKIKVSFSCYTIYFKYFILKVHMCVFTKNVFFKNWIFKKVAEPKGWPAQDIWNLVGSTLLNDVDIDESITKLMVEKINLWKNNDCMHNR